MAAGAVHEDRDEQLGPSQTATAGDVQKEQRLVAADVVPGLAAIAGAQATGSPASGLISGVTPS